MRHQTRAAALIERAAQTVTSFAALNGVADAHYAETKQTVVIPTGSGFQIAPKYNPTQRIAGFRRPKYGDLLGTVFGGTPLEFNSLQDAQDAIEQGRLTFAGVISEKAGPATFAQFVARHRGILDDVADNEQAAAAMTQQMIRSLGYRDVQRGWMHPESGAFIDLKDVSWNGTSPNVWLVGKSPEGRIQRDFRMHRDDDIESLYNLLAKATTI